MAGDNTTIARPYAEAVFKRAQEANTLDQWSDALGLLAAVVQDEQVAKIIANPKTGSEQRIALMLDIGGDHLDQEAQNLVRLLVRNGRLSALPEIATLYDALKNEGQGAIDVKVVSAFEVSDEQQQQLAEALKKRLDRDIHITSEVDPSLIGGVRIRAGDLVIDGSVQGRLQKLATELGI